MLLSHWPKPVTRPSQIQAEENQAPLLDGRVYKLLWSFFFLFPQLGVSLAEGPELPALLKIVPFFPKESHLRQGHSSFPAEAHNGNWSVLAWFLVQTGDNREGSSQFCRFPNG